MKNGCALSAEFIPPPKSLLRKTGQALVDFQMLQAGDKVLLGVSGGKDSLSLLHILHHFQRHAPVKFTLAVITVDPEIDGFLPAQLKPYIKALDLPYFMPSQSIMADAQIHMKGDSFCAYCARMKRGMMYSVARQHGFNVLALAQHLDDLAESLLMSLFYGGKLNTMKAHYTIDAGDLRVIRPLVYVRERQLATFAKAQNLPVVADSCPACFRKPTKREHIKQLLAQQEHDSPTLFKNLLTAMQPLLRG
jgi:tRNA 2-thiocytidine biosynthesis protein TtcA